MGAFRSKLCPRVSPSNLSDVDSDTTSSTESVFEMPQNLPSTAVDKKFTIIWLDANANSSDIFYQTSLSRLRRVFTSFHTFTNSKDCAKFLSTVKEEMIIMVTSDLFFEKMLPRIKSMLNIHSVYIYFSNGEAKTLPDQDYHKVKGIFTRVEPICSSITRSAGHFKHDSLIMSIIPSMKYSKNDLQQVNQLFVYWLSVKQIILETKYDNEAIKDFTKFCRTQYFGNNVELKNIDEFGQNYQQHSPAWWYKRNDFVFDMLNRALQTQDIEIIILMGFFIKDLYHQLEKLQVETWKTHKLPIVAYRSQIISNENFEKMKSIRSSRLAFNNFIMADTDYESSLKAARGAQNTDTGVGIIFRMKVDSKLTASPFAFMNDASGCFNKGNDILFSMHSIFRLGDLKQTEDRVWEVDLMLSEANDEYITSLAEVVRHETQEATSWFKLAQLMTIIHDYDHAKDIYFALLELGTGHDPLKKAYAYNELGVLEDEMGNYASALSFYQKAIEIREQNLPANHRSLSVSYNNIGEVQRQMGDYYNALTTHQKTLDIKKRSLSSNDLSFATTYNNIGLTNELLGEFSTALVFYQKSLEIKRKALPPDHPELAKTYNNIGELQREMGNYPAALTNFEKALQIRLKKVPPTDTSLAIIYNNIGLIHHELGNFPRAIMYLEKSLDIKLKTFTSNHPSLAFSYNNIGGIHQQMGKFAEALSSYQTALDIQEKTLAFDHPDIAITYTNIGVANQAMANYSAALSFYEKALSIRQRSLPPDHPSLGVSYNNLGHLHQLTGEYNSAIDYYEKTLKLQKKSLTSNHPALAATYNNIADIQRKLGDYKKALTLYKKSLDIKKKSLPDNHPTLVVTYNNMGAVHQLMKNYPAALECYKQTLEIQQKTLPANHPDLAAVHNNIGVCRQSMKEYTTALECYKKALEIQTKCLAATHPDIATTYNSIATVLINLGDYEGALENEKRAVDIATQALAPDHPHLITFKNYYERISIKVASMKKKE